MSDKASVTQHVEKAYQSHYALAIGQITAYFSEAVKTAPEDMKKDVQALVDKAGRFSELLSVLVGEGDSKEGGHSPGEEEIKQAVQAWNEAVDYGKRYIGQQKFWGELSDEEKGLEKAFAAANNATQYLLKQTKSKNLEQALLKANEELQQAASGKEAAAPGGGGDSLGNEVAENRSMMQYVQNRTAANKIERLL